VESVSQKVGAPRTGEVQITRPWQGSRATGRVNVKGPTGRLASRSRYGALVGSWALRAAADLGCVSARGELTAATAG
jgi:hypothetical protein